MQKLHFITLVKPKFKDMSDFTQQKSNIQTMFRNAFCSP